MAAAAASAAYGPMTEGVIVPKIQRAVLALPGVRDSERIKQLLCHPAGPFTIHFWAPTTKWLISAANIADLHRPVEKMSMAQQGAVGTTGVIWSYYSLCITPVNYNLLVVNAVMACTSSWHISRMVNHYYLNPPKKA